MELKETTVSSQTTYKCKVFTVTKDTVQLPNGDLALRDRVLHNGGSGVLPITPDGQIILVEQYRYGVGKVLLEIPAGKLEAGEDPLECAKRELREEVGGIADEIIELGQLAVSPAYDSEIIYIYLAKCARFAEQKLDDNEFLRVHRYSFEDAIEKVLHGEITDAKTQIAILKANVIINNSRI